MKLIFVDVYFCKYWFMCNINRLATTQLSTSKRLNQIRKKEIILCFVSLIDDILELFFVSHPCADNQGLIIQF